MTTPVPNIPAALVQAGMDALVGDGHALDTNLPAGACDCPECRERVVRAVLGAVFAACEVREHWSVRTPGLLYPVRDEAEARRDVARIGPRWAQVLRHLELTMPLPAAEKAGDDG